MAIEKQPVGRCRWLLALVNYAILSRKLFVVRLNRKKLVTSFYLEAIAVTSSKSRLDNEMIFLERTARLAKVELALSDLDIGGLLAKDSITRFSLIFAGQLFCPRILA